MDPALLVNSLAEKELRQTLKTHRVSLPNQKRKPILHAMDLSAHGPHSLDSCPGRSQEDILGEEGTKKDCLLLTSRGQGHPRSGVKKGIVRIFQKITPSIK